MATLALALLLPATTLHAAAPSLEQLQRLAEVGGYESALQLYATHAPERGSAFAAWEAWQQAHLELLARHGAWQRLLDHTATLTAGGEPTPDWLIRARIEAHLQLQQGGAARLLLRRLLWQPQGVPEAAAVQRARRQVAESYLLEARVSDAYTALLRYRQEYDDRSPEWAALRSEILLRSEHYRELLAIEGLDPVLRLLAELRTGSRGGYEVAAAAEALLAQGGSGATAELWGIVAEAAAQGGDRPRQIHALEQLLLAGGSRYHAFDGGTLWAAYRAHGEGVANRAQLLFGQFPAWLEEAARLEGEDPIAARALWAVVLHEAEPGSEAQQAAQQRLLDDFGKIENGGRLLHALATGNDDFAGVVAAAEAGAGHEANDPFAELQRLAVAESLDEAALLPVVSGLAAESDESLWRRVDTLLTALLARDGVPPRLRWRIALLRGDRARAVGLHAEAIAAYLEPLPLERGVPLDGEGWTAPFEAAATAAEAGWGEEAARLYRELLQRSETPLQQQLIEHRLQQLGLARE